MSNFRKVRAWQAAHQLAVDTFQVCDRLRGTRRPRLIDQLTGAALSISGNIAEGRGHTSTREFIRFLGYSLTSTDELESHTQLAVDVGAMSEQDFKLIVTQLIEVRKMLHGLIKKLKNAPTTDG